MFISLRTKPFLKYMKVQGLNTLLLFLLSACSHLPISEIGISPKASPRTGILNIKPQENQKITLLVPLHGRYTGPGQAIRNGFLAAYDEDKKNRNVRGQITIVDTAGTNVVDLYQKAIAQGADAIVGPLTKEEVQLIARQEHPVPILALNTLEQPVNTRNFYQFGLSPEDEAKVVAQKAYGSGYRNAIILAPNTPWGKKTAQALYQQWTNLGGNVADQLIFTSDIQTLSAQIPHFLKIIENKHRPSKLPSQRRQDFDVILLAAPPSSAKEVLSILRFNYVQNIPIYATSSVFSGNFSTENKELDGINFSDIPWLNSGQLSNSMAAILRNTQNLWPDSQRQFPRFYALGADAYRLIAGVPDAQQGGTGYLTVDKHNKLHRSLIWFQMRNGTPVPIAN